MSETNLYQRAGVWWFRATIAGVEIRESLRTSDVKAARRLRDKRLEQHKATAYHGAVSWHDAFAQWADHASGQIGAKTAKRYAVSLKQCEPWLKSKNVSEIDGRTITDLMTARKRAGAGAATIRRDLTAISRVLEFAEAMGWREGNPTLSKRRILKERRDPIELPTWGAIASVLAASSVRFAGLIEAAMLTGCRQDELVNVTWLQFNPKAQTLDVIGKGNKRRTISLSAQATAHFQMQPRTLSSRLIFCRESGEPFEQAASDFCHFRRLAVSRDKTVKRFRFHDLRHLYAVEYLRAGGNLYDLAQQLGHTSVKTTEQVYLAFLTPDEAKGAKHGVGTKDGNATAVLQFRRSEKDN